jgi:hypothetical protein
MKPTETTDTLLRALKQIDRLDVNALFGSAVDVSIDSYTPDRAAHLGRVSLPAEHFGPVREALRTCLLKAIESRKQSLVQQLAEINAITCREPQTNT